MHLDKSSLLAIYINNHSNRKYACQLSTILLILKALGFVSCLEITSLIDDIKNNNTFCNFTHTYRKGKNKLKVLNLDVVPIEKDIIILSIMELMILFWKLGVPKWPINIF